MITDPSERREVDARDAEIAALKAEVERLRIRLLSAAGDDLCRLTQDEIKELSSGGVKIPPKEEFIASCERFHAQMANEAGVLSNCLTLAQLVAENEQLRRHLQDTQEALEAYKEATGIVKETALVDQLNRSLSQEAERNAELRRLVGELAGALKPFLNYIPDYLVQYGDRATAALASVAKLNLLPTEEK